MLDFHMESHTPMHCMITWEVCLKSLKKSFFFETIQMQKKILVY